MNFIRGNNPLLLTKGDTAPWPDAGPDYEECLYSNDRASFISK